MGDAITKPQHALSASGRRAAFPSNDQGTTTCGTKARANCHREYRHDLRGHTAAAETAPPFQMDIGAHVIDTGVVDPP